MKPRTESAIPRPAFRRVMIAVAVLLVAIGVLFVIGANRSPVGASRTAVGSPAPDSSATPDDTATAPAAPEGTPSTIALSATAASPASTPVPTTAPKTTAPKTTAPTSAPPKTTAPKTTAPKSTARTSAPPEAAAPVAAAPPPLRATPTAAQPIPGSIESLLTGRVMHAVTEVNVRNAPGTDGTTVISTLAGNAVVTAGQTVDGWVPITSGETFGWVAADYLTDGEAPRAPEVQAADAAAPAQPQASSGNWMTSLLPRVDPGGAATWEFWRNGGLGATDGHNVYIDPDTPVDQRFSVMIHEYSHVLQVQVYGSLDASAAAMSAQSGMSATAANESTADCMALMQGATWVDYGCQDSLRAAAAAILAGHPA